MAQVPYDEGVPDVLPRESVPDDYQHIQANPAEFGGLIAQGAEKAGAGISTAAKFFGEVQTDDAANTALTRANTALNKFRSLQGADALNAQQPTQDEIDNAFKEGRSGLSTPLQQTQYDQIVRNYQQRYISGIMASHADQQAKTFATQTNDNTANLHLTAIAQHPNDPLIFNDNMREVIAARVKQAQMTGQGEEGLRMAAADGRAQALSARVNSMAATGNPAGALKMLNDNQADLSIVDRRNGFSYYDQLERQVQTRGEQQHAVQRTQQIVSDLARNYQPMPLAILQNAIYGQESGHGANTRTSPTGNVGGMQVGPPTFRQFAYPGENINNAADNKAVGFRIIANYYQQYNGDPYRVAVAYYSGPGNVSPPGSPTPWIHDISHDKNGNPIKPVSVYVNDVVKPSGQAPQAAGVMPHAPLPGNDPYALHAAAMKRIMTDSDLNENEKQHAFQFLNRSFTQAQVAAEADVKAKKTANDNAANDYVSTFMKSGATPQMLTAIANDPNLNWETKENLQKVATSEFGLESTTQFGKAYADTYKRIFVAPDDPTRINDINDILKLGIPGQDNGLTPRGVQELGRVFQASRKDPDQAAVNRTSSALIDYAKKKLSFDQEMLFPGVPPLKDPKGEQIFDAQFVPKFEAWKSAQVKAGKDPMEFLTQENIDKLMEGMRPKAQMAADRIRAEGGVGGEAAANAPPPPAPENVAPQVWNDLLKAPPTNQMTGRPTSPLVYGRAITNLYANPGSDVYKQSFNKWFGSKGAMADDILQKLAPQKTEAPAAAAPLAGAVPVKERGATWLPQTLLPPELRRNPPPVEKPPPQYDEHMNPPALGIRG